MTTDKPRDPAEVAAENLPTQTALYIHAIKTIAAQKAELERLRKELDEQTERAKQIQAKKCLQFWMSL